MNNNTSENTTPCKKCGAKIKENEKICPKCGAKQNAAKWPFLIGSIIFLALLCGGIAIAVSVKGKSNNSEQHLSENEYSTVQDKISAQIEISQDAEAFVLPRDVLNKLEEELKISTPNSGIEKTTFIGSEVVYATDLKGDLINLRDTINNTVDVATRDASGTLTSEFSVRSNTRRASTRGGVVQNDSLEDTLHNIDDIRDTILALPSIGDITEKLVGKVFFKYGSYLDIKDMSVDVERILLVSKTEDKKEFASIVLGLNDLISRIPKDKVDSVVFIVMGYADTTLFNGISEVSERSEKFNTELSLKRAESIKAILTGSNFGISPEKVITYGFGYSKNASETTGLEKYRRVDIVVSFQ